MAILQTDFNNIAVTNNSGKILLRTSGSVLDYVQNGTTRAEINVSVGNGREISRIRPSITPKSNASRILVTFNINWSTDQNGFYYFSLRRYINGALNYTTGRLITFNIGGIDPSQLYNPMNYTYIDHPNTTATVQYRVLVTASGPLEMDINRVGNPYSSMQLLELA